MTKLKALRSGIVSLWKSSALIQGTLALMFGGTLCYLAIVGHEMPPILLALLGTIIGFYFRAKTNQKE